MDIVFQIYLVLCGAVIPLVYFWARFDIRMYLFLLCGLSLIVVMWFFGTPAMGLRSVTGAAGGLLLPLAILVTGSNIWTTNSHRSTFETMSLLGYMFLCGIAHYGDKHVVLICLFAPAPFIALWNLLALTFGKKIKRTPPFFNTNHLSGYLVMQAFIGYWLAINTDTFLSAGIILVVFTLTLSACRGAWIGIATGALFIFIFAANNSMPETALVISAAFLFLAAIYIKRPSFVTSMRERFGLYITAIQLIKEKPIFGWGLQTFVREQFKASLRVRKKHPSAYMPAKGLPDYFPKAHRVHNDFFEITQELGLFGLTLLILIGLQIPWTKDPVLSAGIIAVLVHSLFFFPLRTVKIGAPFYIVAGLMLADAPPCPYASHVTTITLAVILFQVFRIHVFRRFMSVLSFKAAVKAKDPRKKQEHIRKAVAWDPGNSYLQSNVYFTHVNEFPATALNAAGKALFHYDGSETLWSAHDQYARALLRTGSLLGARHHINQAMTFKPNHKPGLEFIAYLDKLENKAVSDKKTRTSLTTPAAQGI